MTALSGHRLAVRVCRVSRINLSHYAYSDLILILYHCLLPRPGDKRPKVHDIVAIV